VPKYFILPANTHKLSAIKIEEDMQQSSIAAYASRNEHTITRGVDSEKEV